MQRRRYRNKAIFAAECDLKAPLDRNARAKLIHSAEAIESRTKQRGRQNGAISRPGLMVLRVLLFKFLSRDGRCFPSYDALCKATGLCRQSVSNALGRLEASGLLRITRRLVRREIWRINPWTEIGEWIVTTVQTSNWYSLTSLTGGASLLAPKATHRADHPAQRQNAFAFFSTFEPSMTDRQESLTSP